MSLNVGVIGAGRWGRNHIRVLSEIGCNLVGISDVDPGAEKLAKKYKVMFRQDYMELLPHVDAVSVVVPTDLHYRVVKDCLEAGKHVLVEKPMVFDSIQARELIGLAREKGLVLMVGYLFRYNAAVIRLKELMKDVGDIQYITARYVHSSKPPRKDCGVVFNFGSHLIDILTFILEDTPAKVFCKNLNYLSREREDASLMIFDFGRFMASLEASWFHPIKSRDIWVIGSKKKIYADLFEQMIRVYPIEITQDSVRSGAEEIIEINKNEPLKEELRSFCSMVQEGKQPENVEDELEIIRIMDACLRSASESREIKL